MIGWIIAGFYCLGYVAVWRTVVWWYANVLAFGRVDGQALALGAALGSLMNLFWPVIAVGLIARKVYEARGEDIAWLMVPRSHKRRIQEDEQARRIRDLERELGIGA